MRNIKSLSTGIVYCGCDRNALKQQLLTTSETKSDREQSRAVEVIFDSDETAPLLTHRKTETIDWQSVHW
ncbi:hypothetical protein [Microseira sp. BLCC-F43]|uniref:hypothetical protein n=1 Tax=Microseira sp. BLCC-F43 TaxID=3153602 RepID=UPI0035B7D166